MASTNWTVTIGATSFTSIVQSMSFNIGRQNYFDPYAGGACTVTVRNNTGQAASLNQGDLITVGNDLSGTVLYFYVVEVTFQDDIAANGNTATITGRDALGQLYQGAATDGPVFGYTNTCLQAGQLMTQIAPYYPPNPPSVTVNGRAFCTDTFADTTVGERISQLIQTENSSFGYDGLTIDFRKSAAPGLTTVAFALSTGAGLVYSSITRKYPNANYPTNVRLNSTTVGQTESSVAGQYRRNYDRDVLLTSATQQQAQTDWFANVLSDTTAPYIDLQFSDVANASAKVATWLSYIPQISGSLVNLTYQVPGGSTTTRYMVVEGTSVNIVPGSSQWTVYMSPTVVYDLFTLDSSIFGILNTNRLGW